MTLLRLISVLFIAAAFRGHQACAAVEVFFDFTEWQSALTSTTTIDFTGLPNGFGISDQYADQGVLFPPNDTFILHGFSTFPNDGAGLHSGVASGEIAATLLEPQFGIAFHFAGLMQMELSHEGQAVFLSDIYGGGVGNFVGFVADSPFDGAVLFDPLDPVAVIDDLHFGVPAPGALGLIAIAAMVGGRRRRQEARSSSGA
jgi:hypothetical protein